MSTTAGNLQERSNKKTSSQIQLTSDGNRSHFAPLQHTQIIQMYMMIG